MAYTFNLVFRGLCGFVPSTPIDPDKDEKKDWVGVFLVRADHRVKRQKEISLSPHYSFLGFSMSDLVGLSNAPQPNVFMRLVGEDIVIMRGVSPGGVIVRGGTVSGPIPANSTEESFFRWVSNIDKVQAGAGKVDEDLFAPSPQKVVARVHLTDGTLMTKKVVRFDGTPVLHQFDPIPDGGKPVEQALAFRAVLEIKDVSGPLTIRFRGFGSDRVRELVFKDPGAGGKLNISVLNLCMEDFVEDPDFPRTYPLADDDYRWYYMLTKNFSSEVKGGSMPVPKKFELAGGEGGGEFARCTKTQFSAPGSTQVQRMIEIVDEIIK